MNVLITGGYGFIGSFVAEKFFQEGHKIYILDDLSTGQKDFVSLKHKAFLMDIKDSRVERIFQSTRFEVVIHLAAQVGVQTSVDHPVIDAETNIAGLIHLLHLSRKYKVKKFLFASSAAVYGPKSSIPIPEDVECNPISPYGINKLMGESYCQYWQDVYGLDTVCVRFSNVYGPRQGGGVVSTFLQRIAKREVLSIYGDGEQSRDFIYVKDVADALYRVSVSDVSGTFNLSTNEQVSLHQLIEFLTSISDEQGNSHEPEIKYMDFRESDIQHSRLDNEAFKQKFDWIPGYTLHEGLTETYFWYYGQISRKRKQEKKQKREAQSRREQEERFKKTYKPILPFFENILLFFMIFSIEQFVNLSFMGFDLKVIYIIFIALVFGKTQAMLAASFSIILYSISQMQTGADMITLFIDNDGLIHFALYILIGLMIGYVVDKRKFREESIAREHEVLREEHEFLEELYKESKMISEELQQQIIHSEDGIGKIYHTIKQLDSLEPEDIFTGAIDVIEGLLQTNTVSIYTVNNDKNFLRLASKSNHPSCKPPTSYGLEQFPALRYFVEQQSFYFNRDMDPDLPQMMAPITKENKIIATVHVEEVNFEHLSLYYENVFSVVIKLISDSLERAITHVQETENDRYLLNTNILKPKYFNKILQSKKRAQEQLNIPFTIFKVNLPIKQKRNISDIQNHLRDTDHIGIDDEKQTYIILSNTSSHQSQIVYNRLNELDYPIEEVSALYV